MQDLGVLDSENSFFFSIPLSVSEKSISSFINLILAIVYSKIDIEIGFESSGFI